MSTPIMNSMKATELKNLVEAGTYKPDPSRVAIGDAAAARRPRAAHRGLRERS